LEGFWPSKNWRTNYEHASILNVVDVDPKDPIIPPYCGPKNMRPSLSIVAYRPFHDLFTSNFVLLWPLNLTIYFVWMGKAKSDVVRDQKNENCRKVYVQWWVLMRKGSQE
jgi:hypothetical protein